MICTHPDQRSRRGRPGRPPNPATASPHQPAYQAADAPLPLLSAIVGQLRHGQEADVPALRRTARRILEEAFRAVDHTPAITDPLPLTELSP